MLTCNDQNHMQHSASSSKTEGNEKGISCLEQELPKGIIQSSLLCKMLNTHYQIFPWNQKA